MIPKDGRKLPNCPIPSDPWQVFLRKSNGEFGIVAQGHGATLEEALENAIRKRSGWGLKKALQVLSDNIERLTEAVHACQD